MNRIRNIRQLLEHLKENPIVDALDNISPGKSGKREFIKFENGKFFWIVQKTQDAAVTHLTCGEIEAGLVFNAGGFSVEFADKKSLFKYAKVKKEGI